MLAPFPWTGDKTRLYKLYLPIYRYMGTTYMYNNVIINITTMVKWYITTEYTDMV